jgi:hypothetical protein
MRLLQSSLDSKGDSRAGRKISGFHQSEKQRKAAGFLQSSRRLGDHLPSEEIVGAPDEMEVAKHRIGRLDRGGRSAHSAQNHRDVRQPCPVL